MAQKLPTLLERLAAVPAHQVGQILDGELYVSPRPGSDHAAASSALGEELGPAFKRGRGGPGGWILLDEPELHLGSDVLVPDLAGWRRERMPERPSTSAFELAPDWVCEVLSRGTAKVDRKLKRRIYARERVGAFWLIDTDERTLEVLRLDGDDYRIELVASDDDRVRAFPFEALELDLSVLWAR
jgi:Uma2 family endonuclease